MRFSRSTESTDFLEDVFLLCVLLLLCRSIPLPEGPSDLLSLQVGTSIPSPFGTPTDRVQSK